MMIATALARRVAGLSMLPVHGATKLPYMDLLPWDDGHHKHVWEPYRRRQPSEEELRRWCSAPGCELALVTGLGSGGLEGLDFDNKGSPPADELYASWLELVEEEAPGLVARLPLEQSQSGGYHHFWRSEGFGGNLKLAQRPPTEEEIATAAAEKKTASPQTLIETRGEGGYILTAPAPGYTLLQGAIEEPPELTVDERALLLRAARARSDAGTRGERPQGPAQPARGGRAAAAG